MGNYIGVDEMAFIIADVVNKRKKGSGDSVSAYYEVANNHRPPGIILDNTKLKHLGWNLKTDIIRGITNVIELYEGK